MLALRHNQLASPLVRALPALAAAFSSSTALRQDLAAVSTYAPAHAPAPSAGAVVKKPAKLRPNWLVQEGIIGHAQPRVMSKEAMELFKRLREDDGRWHPHHAHQTARAVQC